MVSGYDRKEEVVFELGRIRNNNISLTKQANAYNVPRLDIIANNKLYNMELFIKKLWGKKYSKDNYIGGTEDTLLLIDYFGKQTESKLSLHKILFDIHLYILLEKGFVGNGDVYFTETEPHNTYFDTAINVVIDLSAILLENLKNSLVDMNLLDGDRKYSNKFTISTSQEDVRLLIKALDKFIVAPQDYELTEPLSEKSFQKLIADCKEISNSLNEYINLAITSTCAT